MNVKEAIKHLNENSKERKFTQAYELIVNIKNVDLKNPENRFSDEIILENLSKQRKVGVIGSILSKKAENADLIIDEKSLNEYVSDKKAFKKAISKVDYLIAEAPLMMKIGKEFGRILGPKGKMPKPLPPNADPKPIIDRLKKTVVLKLRETPVIQVLVGYEDMSPQDIENNISLVFNSILKHLPQNRQNIRSIYLKKTMSKPVKLKL